MSKPSHFVVLTKLVLYLNFLLWHLGSEIKFQATADTAATAPATADTAATAPVLLLPDDEVSTLTAVVDKLGLKSAPYISKTYCQASVSSYGIAIECECYKRDNERNMTCYISKISMNNAGLTGVIPEEVGGFGYLKHLILSNNDLHGPIPATLGNLINLQTLDLSRNQLTGSIPETLGSLQNLRWLYLQYNLLDSTIPRCLGSLRNLQDMYLHFNRLSGSIPDELGNLVSLAYMSLAENRLTGRLPDALGNLTSLRGFWVTSNSLSDTFPESYRKLTRLKSFSIAGNYISGPLPVDIIKNWIDVETLTLEGNNFKGNLTKEVFNLPNLQYLMISDLRNATFELPSNITNTKFIYLILRNCSINGSIPKYIGDQMPTLKFLDLSFNNLTGGLPEYMKSDLRYMSFSTNMLNGTIPDWILQADQTRIDLSFNNLMDSGLPLNQDLNLFACCRNSSATSEPEIMYMRDPLDMMNTYCQGKEQKYHSLFINCGGGETVVNGITYDQDNDTSPYYTSPKKNWAYSSSGYFFNSSDYTKNVTCGVSVAEAPLYDRARLSPVSLKYYAFCLREGTYNVTLKFAEIVYSEDTDYTSLRKRAFDVYIQDDKVLHNFNIIKQARGPNEPITKNFTAVVSKNNSLLMIHMYWDGKGSIEGEPTFNGPLISAISVTPDFKIDDEKLRPLHIALIAIASIIIGMLLLLAFSWSMGWLGSRNSRKIKVGEEKTDEGTQEIRVTLKELIDATGKFRDKKRIIGIGSLGTVYEAQLQGQTKSTVAVKKLSSHLKEKEKEKLEKELKLLSALDHENVIKLFDYHIEKDLQLLVYEYMENKSLEVALSVDPNTRSVKFTWNTRLNICLGIARGLEYLHNHPSLNITHLNIKADNILLDGNLEPKISDFRLAHLCAEEDKFTVIGREVKQGYMPPEYYQGIWTSKADVYSFGVIILEIVSWKRSVSESKDGTTEILVNTANEKEQRGKLEEMVDEKLDAYNAQQALTILRLALKCTSSTPSMRPTMSDVVSVLLGKKTIGDLSKFSPNDSEKIKGSGDLTRADSMSTTSMDLTSIPSTSSPSTKAKDELESM